MDREGELFSGIGLWDREGLEIPEPVGQDNGEINHLKADIAALNLNSAGKWA
jgi:hypothetical protein